MDDSSKSAVYSTRTSVANSDAGQSNRRPLVNALALGFVAALAPSLAVFLLPTATLADANGHPRPASALLIAGALLVAMLVALVGDWRAGKASLPSALRALAALALVAGCALFAVALFQPENLAILGLSLVMGFAFGLGIAFTTNGSATYTDASLALLGAIPSAVALFCDIVIYLVTFPVPPRSGPNYSGILLPFAYAEILIGMVVIVVTAVPLGGIVGGWLRRGKR